MLSHDFKLAFEKAPSCGKAWILTQKAKIISEVDFIVLKNEFNLPTLVILFMPLMEKEIVRTTLSKYIVADDVQIFDTPEDIYQRKIKIEDSLEKISPRHPLGKEELFQIKIDQTEFVLKKGNYRWNTELSFEEAFERGTPRWGHELFADDFFLEFPLAQGVSFDKGCYVGQETVARGTFRGKVNKTFARITSTHELKKGPLLDTQGAVVGEIRSANGMKALGIVKLGVEIPNCKVEWLVNEKTFRGER